MKHLRRLAEASLLLVLLAAVAGCVIEPREGYWDRDHHRYYHEHNWHECDEHHEFCR